SNSLTTKTSMKQNFSRRNWLRKMTAGMAGVLIANQGIANTIAKENKEPFNESLALTGPTDAIKITKLEVIPVNSLRTIFVKLYTDAGIIGIGEGTVEGRITTVTSAIKELEQYLIGKDP